MRHIPGIFLLAFALASSLSAQVTDATVCDILANPQSFDGKIVRIKGTVIAGFDEFLVKDASCNQPVNAIWLAYPEGTKAKAGAVAMVQLQLSHNNGAASQAAVRTAVQLDKNKDFKQFDALLSTPYKSGGMCLGCERYSVSATLVGRLDGVKNVGLVRETEGKIIGVAGFGNLNLYRARLVLQSVSDVTSHEIDYSKSSEAAKGDSVHDSGGGDPIAAGHLAAKAFGPDSAAGKQVENAAAAYGKEGEHNGVEVNFGIPNEVPKNEGGKGSADSPDGLLFNCTFDMDRLKGDALSRAITHAGMHIFDIRSSQPGGGDRTLYNLEFRAWQTTVLTAVAFQQKTLTVPGGYVIWNSAWAAADRNKIVNEGITGFLKEWAMLKE